MKRTNVLGLTAIVGFAVASACGGSSDEDIFGDKGGEDASAGGPSGCVTDDDCKGARICVQGECVDPGTAGSGTAGSGTAGSGTAGVAGTGTAGTGTAGTGTAGTGAAGAAGSGAGGTAGTGAGGAGGSAGAAGSGTGGTAGTGTGGAAGSGGGPSGPPITAPDNQWTWVPFPEAKCRNGSETGIAINPNSSSSEVMIFLEGGGACYNGITCAQNPSSFGQSSFNSWQSNGGTRGVFDRTQASNPVRDWNYVYVPYCTGDVHAGNNPGGNPGLGPQQYVGYRNIGLYLQRIVPTFPSATRVLLTGVSAGGFGAAANYDRVSIAFGTIPVHMLDDSGPPMSDTYITGCLQDNWRQLWGFDSTLLADCGSACPNNDDYVLDFVKYLANKYSNRRLGLIESTQDTVIRFFYGFGLSNCNNFLPMSGSMFEQGLLDGKSQLGGFSAFHSFLFTGNDHTSLGGNSLYSRTSQGTALVDWFDDFLNGSAGHVGP